MKDLMAMAEEARKEAHRAGNYFKAEEFFADAFIKELATISGKDLAPYLTCKYQVPSFVYEVKIQIPARILEKI